MRKGYREGPLARSGDKSNGIRPEEMASHTAKTTQRSTKVKVFKQVCAQKRQRGGACAKANRTPPPPDQRANERGRKGAGGGGGERERKKRGKKGEKRGKKRGKNSEVTLKSCNF